MESMAEGMIKDLVASGRALADDMTGAPSVLVRCLAAQLEVQLVRANALATENARIAEQREYYEGVIADGSKRIAELEKGHQESAKQTNSWRRLAKLNIAERGKDISELKAARQRIAELETREVTLPDRKSEVFWPGDAAEFDILGYVIAVKSAIRAAGIKVKES